MAQDNNNKLILAVIALLLLAILGFLIFQSTQKTPEEKIADSISQTVEDIGNSISHE